MCFAPVIFPFINITSMKKFFILFLFSLLAVTMEAQGVSALDQLKANPRKAYGNDYP